MNPQVDATAGAAPDIQLAAKWETAVLGGELVIGVKHVNRGDQSIILRDPQKDRSVRLAVQRPGGMLDEASFGSVFYTEFDGYARTVVEEAVEIPLEPGASHVWSQDVGLRWPELFAPGENVLVIRDFARSSSSSPNLSNSCKVLVQFDVSKTFPRLLDILGAPDSSIDSKDWAAGWVQLLHPEFVYVSDPEDSASTRNVSAIAEARAWWGLHRNDHAMLARIHAIHHSGLAPAPAEEQ